MQVAESHGPALESVQADFGQRRNHLAKIEINMVTEVHDQAEPFICRSSKIDGKQPPTWLQNPPYLRNTLSSRLVGQMMKHHGAQYGVECRVWKWQLLDSRIFKDYVDTPPSSPFYALS